MSDKIIETGGEAFPCVTNNALGSVFYPGMTLRDYLAAKAPARTVKIKL